MLASPKLKLVEEIVSTFTKEELFWLSGYIAGKYSTTNQTKAVAPAKPVVNKLTITYGTETGNSKKLASEFAAKAKKSGINAKLVSLDQYRLNDLPKEEYLLSIISTQGEGEPPAAAKKFYDHIHNNGFRLDKLKYGVLALGDTSYPLFCKAGEDVDLQLSKLGGERIVPLQKCDVDYESEANDWFQHVLQQLNNTEDTISIQAAPVVAKKSSGKKIYNGTILTNINLNDRGSNKQTHHMEIAGDEIEYVPGDALGVIPENPQSVVDYIIQLLQLDDSSTFTYKDEQFTAPELLKKKLNIIYLPERVVAKYASLVSQDIPATKMGLLDLLRIYPLKDTNQFQQLVDILEPITPRLYSISSSPEAHSGEIHLTVAKDHFAVNDEQKCGLCSGYLTGLPEETAFEFYIHKNAQFRLPEDDKDIIMIGPGTGIAPFRSFLAHRDATGASGRNWLFFGDQHFVTDFLYQTELQNWLETGVLTKLNVAFSRDQKEKVYVQHKMLQHGNELYQWLTSGASVFVCGAKEPMSVDVENTLLQIVEQFGNKTTADAIQFLEQLKEEGRYLKDVY
ncbi:sulfite reductase [Ilyomonas limi]|uniref:assimilatory sulfite reductase (NADPH) n=1 Tax=Ilyomonas limi TaxID=2575867 RepID=A0A4U3L5M0_9BACT|nr:flavodoxin domain-containing protein [Ilyomonas limi]TKK70300.1 sulfite reductase [Ilyomonas limi]